LLPQRLALQLKMQTTFGPETGHAKAHLPVEIQAEKKR
jgi:hypothetical protein